MLKSFRPAIVRARLLSVSGFTRAEFLLEVEVTAARTE